MTTERLVTDGHDRVSCPRRGDIGVDWCFGCPRLGTVERDGDRTTIVCDPGSGFRVEHDAGPLRDMPEVVTAL